MISEGQSWDFITSEKKKKKQKRRERPPRTSHVASSGGYISPPHFSPPLRLIKRYLFLPLNVFLRPGKITITGCPKAVTCQGTVLQGSRKVDLWASAVPSAFVGVGGPAWWSSTRSALDNGLAEKWLLSCESLAALAFLDVVEVDSANGVWRLAGKMACKGHRETMAFIGCFSFLSRHSDSKVVRINLSLWDVWFDIYIYIVYVWCHL